MCRCLEEAEAFCLAVVSPDQHRIGIFDPPDKKSTFFSVPPLCLRGETDFFSLRLCGENFIL
jgi:hypothetical protein